MAVFEINKETDGVLSMEGEKMMSKNSDDRIFTIKRRKYPYKNKMTKMFCISSRIHIFSNLHRFHGKMSQEFSEDIVVSTFLTIVMLDT